MSKTIKVIDLLNKIANGENLPEKILLKDKVYYLIEDDEGNKVYSQGKSKGNWELFIDHKILITRNLNEKVLILDDEVEIIEEEPEIDIQGIRDLPFDTHDIEWEDVRDSINQLNLAVKQLDNQINNK